MILSVDPKLRKKVRRMHCRNRRGLHYYWIFEKALWLALISFIILFPIYCIKTNYLISTITRTGEKSYLLVGFKMSFIVIIGLPLALFVRAIRKRFELVSIGGKTDETLQVLDEKLFHSFRIKNETPVEQIMLVIIDLREINRISYNESLAEISIEGKMLEEITDACKDLYTTDVSNMTERKIKLYDYYTPSLYKTLKSYTI